MGVSRGWCFEKKRTYVQEKVKARQEGYVGEELRILHIRSYLSARFLPIFLCLEEAARPLNRYMKIITPAGQAHSPSAIIYRHPLDKVLVFGVQWKSESFRWKRGRRNNVRVLRANVSESISPRISEKAFIYIIDSTWIFDNIISFLKFQ